MRKPNESLSPERWAYLKALRPSPPRMVHVSAPITYVEVPGATPGTTVTVPIVVKPGITYRRPN